MYKVILKDLVAGSCAGASGILAGYPFDTVKVLIQTQVKPIRYTSTFQTIFLVTKEDGFLRLYRGLMTPMITVAFYNAITFSAYEAAMKKLSGSNQDLWKHGLAGSISGLARVISLLRR